MHLPVPDRHTGLTLLVLLAILWLLGVATYFGLHWWKQRHRDGGSHTNSYSRRLSARLSPQKSKRGSTRRRKPKR